MKKEWTASAMGKARWANVPAEERKRQLTEIGKRGGRPPAVKRCLCGKSTLRRAIARNFDCCRTAGLL